MPEATIVAILSLVGILSLLTSVAGLPEVQSNPK